MWSKWLLKIVKSSKLTINGETISPFLLNQIFEIEALKHVIYYSLKFFTENSFYHEQVRTGGILTKKT